MDIVLDFRGDPTVSPRIVNDGVMGGRSESRFTSGSSDFAVFEGTLSLENGGGFASVRLPVAPGSLKGIRHLVLHVRGDGRRFEARLREGDRVDGIAFAAPFETQPGEWITVEVPIEAFEPTFRGRRPRGVGPVDPASVGQLSLMLADKRAGPFRLEVAWIGIHRESGGESR